MKHWLNIFTNNRNAPHRYKNHLPIWSALFIWADEIEWDSVLNHLRHKEQINKRWFIVRVTLDTYLQDDSCNIYDMKIDFFPVVNHKKPTGVKVESNKK